MNPKFGDLIISLKDKLGLFLVISLGIFLFILFFQPFPYKFNDLNNNLIFNAGLAGIVFFSLILVSIIFSLIIQYHEPASDINDILSYFGGFVILAASSVAFAFYLRYVGKIEITFHIMFKVVLICFVPPMVLRFYLLRNKNIQEIELLNHEITSLKQQLNTIEENSLNITLEFVSENETEKEKLRLANILFVKSADNYVEIYFTEDDTTKKKMLRNTLKNIEMQLKPYPTFVRCHRTCIVNTAHIQKHERGINNYWVMLKNYEEKIPVSRQYILKLKEAISLRKGRI